MSEDSTGISDIRYDFSALLSQAPELAEAARAFTYAGVTSEYDAPALNLVVNHAPQEETITPEQAEALISQIILASGGQVTNPNIIAFMADARASVGSSIKALADLRNEGMRLADIAKGDLLDANSPETRDQKVAQLRLELQEINKKTLEGIDTLKEAGVFAPEEADQWEKRLKAIMQMPDGPEKDRALKTYYSDYAQTLETKRDEADARGDTAQVAAIDAQLPNIQEGKTKTEQLAALDREESLVRATSIREETAKAETQAIFTPVEGEKPAPLGNITSNPETPTEAQPLKFSALNISLSATAASAATTPETANTVATTPQPPTTDSRIRIAYSPISEVPVNGFVPAMVPVIAPERTAPSASI